MEKVSHRSDYTGLFNDKRLEKRAEIISQSLFMNRQSSIHGSTKTEAEQKGFYRFLRNKKVGEEMLIKEITQRCVKNVTNQDILILQDTTSFGLSQNANNIQKDSGVGFVGNKLGIGFLGHCSLVLNTTNGEILGFSDIQLWHRKEDKANNTTRVYKKQPIEEKESYKWIRASLQAKQTLNHARSITIIEDREGDIYEQFSCIADERTQLLIRNRDNRKLSNGKRLYDELNESKVLGTYAIQLYDDLRKKKVKRIATVEVKAIKAIIKKPDEVRRKDVVNELCVYVIEAKEVGTSHNDRICWRIITTKETVTFEQALEVVQKYKLRWYIEQLFRVLKKQGFNIEATQLESGWAIRKLLILLMNTSLRVMQLYLAYDEEESQPIIQVFTEEEIACLKVIETKYLKHPLKTANPFNSENLSWASWIIARLGGWKGNKKQRKPGPIILKRGLELYASIYEGWKLARNLT